MSANQFGSTSFGPRNGGQTSMVYIADFGTPALKSNTAVHAAITLPAAGTTVVTSAITNPDVPRVLIIKGNAASEVGDVVIVGTNIFGAALTETIALNEANAVVGTKAFKTVTSITVPTRTTAGDTVSIGYGDALGLAGLLSVDTVLKGWFNGAVEATLPTLSVDTSDVSKNLITFASAGTFDGTKSAKAALLLY